MLKRECNEETIHLVCSLYHSIGKVCSLKPAFKKKEGSAGFTAVPDVDECFRDIKHDINKLEKN